MIESKKKKEMFYFRMTTEIKTLIENRIKETPGLTMAEFIRECIEKKLRGKK